MTTPLYAFLFVFFTLFAPCVAYTQCNPAYAEIPNNGFDEDCDGLDDIFLILPPYIYTVEGQDFELYFRNVILSKHPQDYVFSVSTVLNGVNSGQKWAFTPTANNVGEFPLSITVKSNGGQVLASANSTVRISPASAPTDMSNKRLVLFGHSFYDQGYLPKYIYDRTHQPNNPPITFHGKRESWANPLARHEGRGGRQARWFMQDWESPIRYGSKVDVRHYFDDVVCYGCRPDWVIVHLDINDFCGYSALVGTTLQEIDDTITNVWKQYGTPLIDSIHAASPTTKIAICFTPMPNGRESAFQSSFAGYAVLNNRWRWEKIVSRLLFKNTERYGNRENENIYLLPEHLDIDDLADYNPSDARHPDPPDGDINTHCGYMEIAKSVYAWIRWVEFHPNNSPPVLHTYYRDADGDGYGNAAQTQTAVSSPSGYIVQSGDCNDNNPNIHPGATEICGNNIDDDCDNAIDEDLIAPVAGCRNTVQLPLNANGTATLTVAQVNQGSFDACSALTFSLNKTQFSCADLGSPKVTLSVHDAAGNSNFCETTVQVVDLLAPVLSCPNRSLDLGPTGQLVISPNALGAQASDNCGPITWLPVNDLHLTCQQANTTINVPLTAKDNAGNVTSCTMQVLVTNITDSDGDGVSNCLDACPNNAATTALLPFFLDADGDGFGNGNAAFFCSMPLGMSSNNLDCNDNNPNIYPGAVEICNNNLDDNCDGATDEDIIAPLASCSSIVSLPLDSNGEAILLVNQVNQGSSDACSTLTFSLSRSQFSCLDLGTTSDTLYIHDAAGNSNFCETTVQVVDLLGPVLSCPDLLLDLGASGQITVSQNELGTQASDNCSPVTWLPVNDLHLTCQQANTTINLPLTAKDNAGNITTCTLHILVTDTTDVDGDGVNTCLDACPDDSTTATLLAFFLDNDQDGFGSGEPIFSCLPPLNASINNLDCDDQQSTIYPGATEIANGLDDDCNGLIDDVAVSTGNLLVNNGHLTLFPSPAQERLYIEYLAPVNRRLLNVSLLEPTGRVLRTFGAKEFSQDKLEIDISGLGAGIYWVRVQLEGGGEVVGRFLKG